MKEADVWYMHSREIRNWLPPDNTFQVDRVYSNVMLVDFLKSLRVYYIKICPVLNPKLKLDCERHVIEKEKIYVKKDTDNVKETIFPMSLFNKNSMMASHINAL